MAQSTVYQLQVQRYAYYTLNRLPVCFSVEMRKRKNFIQCEMIMRGRSPWIYSNKKIVCFFQWLFSVYESQSASLLPLQNVNTEQHIRQ